MSRTRTLLLLAGLWLAAPGVALAVTPGEMLADPALEARAREISAELRCLVCQNQSIDGSNADLARDLRLLVRERLKNGDSNQAVIDYVVSRYGEFVLLKPRFSAQTLFLWGTPLAILLVGIGLVAARLRARPAVATAGLSAEEKAELDRLLKGRSDHG